MDRFVIRSIRSANTDTTVSTSKLSSSNIGHCDSDTVQPAQQLVPAITPAPGGIVKRSLSLEKPMVQIAPADSDCTVTQETGLFVLCLLLKLP